MRNLKIVSALFVVVLSISGCVWIFQKPMVEQVDLETKTSIRTPVRAHLINGETVVFETGAIIGESTVSGAGTRYDLTLYPTTQVQSVPLDSIMAIESFRNHVKGGKSLAISTLATAGLVFGVPALSVAIFGSCPTVYSEGSDGMVLEAEAFPNSIVSLFEVRDVDPLFVRANENGRVQLEIRNEALETHYINHLELLEVRHIDGATVVPAPAGKAYLLYDLMETQKAIDRELRDVTDIVSHADESVYSSTESRLNKITAADFSDYIDLSFAAPEADSAVVYLQLRNSLLNTVYFYESMLSGQGAGSLNWLGTDLESISYAIEIGDFFAQNLGLRVSVWDGDTYHYSGKVGEVGPIAWDEVAVAIPVLQRDSVRVRLDFVADSWRIDRVALASEYEIVPVKSTKPSIAKTKAAVAPDDLIGLIESPDEHYLVTLPGTAFTVSFETGTISPDSSRSFMLASQGYYTEWIRKQWLEESDGQRFNPSSESLSNAMILWQKLKPEYEATFEKSKIPVR